MCHRPIFPAPSDFPTDQKFPHLVPQATFQKMTIWISFWVVDLVGAFFAGYHNPQDYNPLGPEHQVPKSFWGKWVGPLPEVPLSQNRGHSVAQPLPWDSRSFEYQDVPDRGTSHQCTLESYWVSRSRGKSVNQEGWLQHGLSRLPLDQIR